MPDSAAAESITTENVDGSAADSSAVGTQQASDSNLQTEMNDLKALLEASQTSISKLESNNSDLKREKIAEKNKAKEAERSALESEGKFEQLSKHLGEENVALTAQLAELGGVSEAHGTLESRIEAYRSDAKTRAESRMSTWDEDSRSKFNELFPDSENMDPLDLAGKAETFEKSFVTPTKGKSQPGGLGTPADTTNIGQGGSVGARRMNAIDSSLLADLGIR